MTQTTKRDPRTKAYDVWYAKVVQVVRERTQMHPDDLPDWRYVRDYEEGYTPKQTASRAIKYAKEY